MAKRVRDAVKERFWRGVLKRCAASGVSVRAFCRREGLSEQSFFAWRRTIGERDGEANRVTARRRIPAGQPAFVPVVVHGSGPFSSAITLELAGGRVLRFSEAMSAERLAELVAALEARAWATSTSAAPSPAAPSSASSTHHARGVR